MDNNYDLLEHAARAAGLEIIGYVDDMIAQPGRKARGFVIRNERGGDSAWQPLHDGEDAMRLVIVLGLIVYVSPPWVKHRYVQVRRENEGHGIKIMLGKDPEGATCRAIVMVAAEISKRMQ